MFVNSYYTLGFTCLPLMLIEFNEEVCRDLATDKLTVDFLSEILGKVIKMSDTGKESKFPWEKMAANPKPLMRAILQSFLCSSSYAEWDTEWINSTAKSIYYMVSLKSYYIAVETQCGKWYKFTLLHITMTVVTLY